MLEVAPRAEPPVVKIMDYGKYKYDESVAARRNKKNSHLRTRFKELTFKLRISSNDYNTKCARARRFLEKGNTLRVKVWLRGREITRPDMGLELMSRLITDLEDVATVDQQPGLFNKTIIMVLRPLASP